MEVSDSSLGFDRSKKLKLYARSSIPEYWIINVEKKHVEVYSGPTESGYSDALTYQPGTTIEPLCAPGTAIAVAAFVRG